jgi:hypothetical protein
MEGRTRQKIALSEAHTNKDGKQLKDYAVFIKYIVPFQPLLLSKTKIYRTNFSCRFSLL